MTPEFEAIEWSFDEATGVGRITFDRPDALNALSSTLRREFVEAFAAFRDRDDAADGVAVRAVIVSGADRAQAVGLVGDVRPHGELEATVDAFVETLAIVDAYGGQAGQRYERRADGRLRRSADYQEAVAAFRSDREPEFRGR